MSLGRKQRQFVRLSLTIAAISLMGVSTAWAQKKTTTPAPAKAAAPAKPAAHATGGTTAGTAGGKAGTTTTANHGPTTASPRTTTANHAPGGPNAGHPANPGGAHAGGMGSHPNLGGGPEPHNLSYEHRGNAVLSRRPDKSVRDVSMGGGWGAHHNLNGDRRFEHERLDHSRVVVEHGGRGFVEHPYAYRGHEFGRRTYYHGGRVYDHYYGHYYYRGVYVNYYTPAYYYRPDFYSWAYHPWAVPVAYSWGWGGNPWYGYYGYYFTPYPVYPSAAAWLTDYMISQSLAAAYVNAQAQAIAAGGPPPGAAPLTPEVKELISQEVANQISLAHNEALTAQTAVPDPTSSSIIRLLTDNQKHVFLVGHSLDVVNSSNNECAISQGDALQLVAAPPADSQPASLLVLASKGGVECQRGDTVLVQLADLQEMQNHMRETIDAGMGEMQNKAGSGGLPALPNGTQGEGVKSSFMAEAPPPDPNVKTELAQEYKEGEAAENQVLSSGPSADPNQAAAVPAAPIAAPAPAPVKIELGQTVDQVTAALGTPLKIVDLNVKLIYVYKDLKITFKAGKVSAVE